MIPRSGSDHWRVIFVMSGLVVGVYLTYKLIICAHVSYLFTAFDIQFTIKVNVIEYACANIGVSLCVYVCVCVCVCVMEAENVHQLF